MTSKIQCCGVPESAWTWLQELVACAKCRAIFLHESTHVFPLILGPEDDPPNGVETDGIEYFATRYGLP